MSSGAAPRHIGLMITCDDGSLPPAVVRLTQEEGRELAKFLKLTSTSVANQRLSGSSDRYLVLHSGVSKLKRCINEAGFP